jgi:hypothetical protein
LGEHFSFPLPLHPRPPKVAAAVVEEIGDGDGEVAKIGSMPELPEYLYFFKTFQVNKLKIKGNGK